MVVGNIFIFTPIWKKRFPVWQAYFSMGLVKNHPTSFFWMASNRVIFFCATKIHRFCARTCHEFRKLGISTVWPKTCCSCWFLYFPNRLEISKKDLRNLVNWIWKIQIYHRMTQDWWIISETSLQKWHIYIYDIYDSIWKVLRGPSYLELYWW